MFLTHKQQCEIYSNTTLVKVKSDCYLIDQVRDRNSNTTLVKVKFMAIVNQPSDIKYNDSNTTLVKVKYM